MENCRTNSFCLLRQINRRVPEIANSLNSGQDAAEESAIEEVSVDSKVEAAAETKTPASSVEDAQALDFNNIPVRDRSSTVRSRSGQGGRSNPRGDGR